MHPEALRPRRGSRGLGTSERLGLTHSLQLDAAFLLAALSVPARGLNFIEDSQKGMKCHLDVGGLAWLQQARGGQYMEWAGELPGEEGGQVPGEGGGLQIRATGLIWTPVSTLERPRDAGPFSSSPPPTASWHPPHRAHSPHL